MCLFLFYFVVLAFFFFVAELCFPGIRVSFVSVICVLLALLFVVADVFACRVMLVCAVLCLVVPDVVVLRWRLLFYGFCWMQLLACSMSLIIVGGWSLSYFFLS